MDTVKDIQEQISRQKAHDQKRQDDIKAKIAQEESAGYGADKLRAELVQAVRTADAGARVSASRLQAAQEREAAQEKAQETRAQIARDEIEAKQKKAALLAWEKNGGKIADFDSVWESMRLELLKAETQKAIEQKAIDQSGVVFFDRL